MKKPLRWCLRLIIVLLALLAAAATWAYYLLTASLPQLQGEAYIAGLTAPVSVERDVLGVATVRGENRLDIAYSTGFLHAQERFFQMDLLRRSAAGELAALFGEGAVAKDQELRVHRFRHRAQQALVAATTADKRLLQAYSEGVNAGLVELNAAPFEYLILGTDPLPWQPQDSILVIYAMYLDLQDEHGKLDATLGLLHDLLPYPVYDFLTPQGGEWDAPLQPDNTPFRVAPVPTYEVFNLRSWDKNIALKTPFSLVDSEMDAGSNNWAVAASYSRHGGALLANDMHLALRVPNIWYRMVFVYPDARGNQHQITGISLPGAPAIVVGSNQQIAWGFTNANGDWVDLIILEQPDDKSYLTPKGPLPLQYYEEIIDVNGGEPKKIVVTETIWGPVIDQNHRGQRRVLRWVAHDPEAVNLQLLGLETATTVDGAFAVAHRVGGPAQNMVVADRDGNIGWTISGPIPRREGFSGRLPQSWADGSKTWNGWLTPEEYPQLKNPVSGKVWTANARVAAGDDLRKLGFGRYALGPRAQQIRDRLLTLEQAGEADMLALQLDNRGLYLHPWRELLLNVLTAETLAADSRRRELRDYTENWSGHAAVDAVGYRMIRAFRMFVRERVEGVWTALGQQADQRFNYSHIPYSELVTLELIRQQPMHLLPAQFASWQDLFLDAVDEIFRVFLYDGSILADHSWGKYNTSQIWHPLSRFIPFSDYWLDMPKVSLPGDSYMPRVQHPKSGASQRLVVSPGREEQGYFHMPGGQSGHPLSPFYGAGHEDWIEGKTSPFLPGKTIYQLTLLPQ